MVDESRSARLRRVERYARISLVVAGLICICGHLLSHAAALPILGGFVAALGTAALVGGLADWYAVRALFTTPLGIPWHTAIIPRNKDRLVKQIRVLLIEQWLPPQVFVEKIQGVDLVGRVLSFLEGRKGREEVVRLLGEAIAESVEPEELAAGLSRPLARSLEGVPVAPHLANFLRRARRHHWIEPLTILWLQRLGNWAASDRARELLLDFLKHVWKNYKEGSVVRRIFGKMGEALGAVDLPGLAESLQKEILRFSKAQGRENSDLVGLLGSFIEDLEKKLRQDREFADKLQASVGELLDAEAIERILWPLLRSLREDLLADLDSDDSRVVTHLVQHLNRVVERLSADGERREAANVWMREKLCGFIERHHDQIGDLVEMRLRAYSDQHLVEMIENRIGDDLNWIRINGACVGGLIGVTIHAIERLLL